MNIVLVRAQLYVPQGENNQECAHQSPDLQEYIKHTMEKSFLMSVDVQFGFLFVQ